MQQRYRFKPGYLKAFRKALGCNQSVFWQAIGLTQSAGSRYERGDRALPPIVLTEIIRVHIRGDAPVKYLLTQELNGFRRQMREAARKGK